MSASGSSRPKVNLRSTAVKRIMQEAAELADPQEDDFVAAPLEVSLLGGQAAPNKLAHGF